MGDQEFDNWVRQQFGAIEVRLSKIEQAREKDSKDIQRLISQNQELETKIEKISIAFRGLSNSVDNLSLSFNEMTRDMGRLVVKLNTMEEIGEIRDQKGEDRHYELKTMLESIQSGRPSANIQKQPWYKDPGTWKDIGVGLGIALTTVMTAWSASRGTP